MKVEHIWKPSALVSFLELLTLLYTLTIVAQGGRVLYTLQTGQQRRAGNKPRYTNMTVSGNKVY